MPTIVELIASNRALIAERWLDRVVAQYPADAQRFFRKEKNSFANPVGQTLARETRALVDGLAENHSWEQLEAHLAELLRIRTVQEFTPSQAVGFVFALKDVLRETLDVELRQAGMDRAWAAFSAQLDQLGLLAFDLYVRFRDRVFELRIAEVKRRVASLVKHTNYFAGDLDPGMAVAGPGNGEPADEG